jgi:hypothetical protein
MATLLDSSFGLHQIASADNAAVECLSLAR